MATKLEIIKELKAEYPTLRIGDDEQGYTDLSAAEYDKQIAVWADNRLAEDAQLAKSAADATAKAALLERIGMTADEATLLLG